MCYTGLYFGDADWSRCTKGGDILLSGLTSVYTYVAFQLNDSDLWHVRFRRPSYNMVKHLIRNSASKNNCTVCFHPNQTSDLFPLS